MSERLDNWDMRFDEGWMDALLGKPMSGKDLPPEEKEAYTEAYKIVSEAKLERRRGKLKREDIPGIKARINAGETLRSIAVDFGVHAESIGRIKRGLSWADVPAAS